MATNWTTILRSVNPTNFGILADFDSNLKVVVNDVFQLSRDIRSFREPLVRSIRNVIQPSWKHSMEVGGRPPWEELAEATIRIKADGGYPPDILVRTGKMRRSLGYLSVWNIWGGYLTGDAQASVDATKFAPYASFHILGTRWMPVRDFMALQPEDEVGIANEFDNWLGERLARRGF